MLLNVIEESGGTLTGAVDGRNRTFQTTLPMRLDRPVRVYVNGLLKVSGLEDGYDLSDARTVVLRETPRDIDTVAVDYGADPVSVGVQGSQPRGLQATSLRPEPINVLALGGPSQRLRAVCDTSRSQRLQVVVRP